MSSKDKMVDSQIKRVFKKASPIEEEVYIELEKWRALFFKMGLFSKSQSDLVSYSQLSKRLSGAEHFIITGENTQKSAHLSGQQYAKVTKLDEQRKLIEAQGTIPPPPQAWWHGKLFLRLDRASALFQIDNESLVKRLAGQNSLRLEAKDLKSAGLEELKKEAAKNNAGIFLFEAEKTCAFVWGSSVEAAGKLALEELKLARK
ncbi:MAG: hypothetical protein WEB87_03520 [Bacteriovoracaceae bacterium]